MTEQPELALAEPAAPIILNTQHARAMLRARYPSPEWALMEEVAPSTGGGTRYADAVAVGLWASRGHAVHGFEIKVSRSDWLRELKDVKKAEAVFAYCDHWWIVAPKGVVKDGELPLTWGLLEVRAANLTQIVAAPRLEPKPIGRAFFASLMRRGLEDLESRAARQVSDAVIAARKEVRQQVDAEVKRRTQDLPAMEAKLAKFQELTGLSLDRWTGPRVETVKLAQRLENIGGYSDPTKSLLAMADQLARAAETVRKAVAETGLTEPKTTPESTSA